MPECHEGLEDRGPPKRALDNALSHPDVEELSSDDGQISASTCHLTPHL